MPSFRLQSRRRGAFRAEVSCLQPPCAARYPLVKRNLVAVVLSVEIFCAEYGRCVTTLILMKSYRSPNRRYSPNPEPNPKIP